MKLYQKLLFVALLIGSTNLYAQNVEGLQFPEMETETVEDEVIVLPKDVGDKYTLLGLAYSKKAEKDLNTWFSPIYHKFIKEAKGVFASFAHDINVYFVPMFTGVNAVATGKAKKKTAEELDPKLVGNILFYKGKLKDYKDALNLDDKKVPYIFIVNTEGEIVYATSGAYTEAKMDKIEEQLE
ncbi:hypothetical protein E1176_19570 [Fulvivirga sp. RKSG066]|uniref:hypothetical protein n=1 Tax=Fulvivirga aurantia TaxID=2529383 RepID=UPI0012BD353B|nr:hypothetical protein [Fulvivirga aurantia]MTI23237.1 hypothetical protein [Fulvivirga aurantia]